MNKKEIDYQHELKMVELAYERDTALLTVEHKWSLDNQPPQPQYYPQQQIPPQQLPEVQLPQQLPEVQLPQQPLPPTEASAQKYGRKKK